MSGTRALAPSRYLNENPTVGDTPVGGDLTGTVGNAQLAVIGAGGVAVGNSTNVPVISYDTKGRVTTVTTTPIAFPPLPVIGGAIGPIGNGTTVPVVTRDAEGRVTALTSTPIVFPPAPPAAPLPWVKVADTVGIINTLTTFAIYNLPSGWNMWQAHVSWGDFPSGIIGGGAQMQGCVRINSVSGLIDVDGGWGIAHQYGTSPSTNFFAVQTPGQLWALRYNSNQTNSVGRMVFFVSNQNGFTF
jgi:hypothetical protein